MKNGLKKLALGLLIVSVVGSMAGCKKKTASNDAAKKPAFPTTREAIKWDKEKYKGKTVKIWQWWDQTVGPGEQAFMDATGATVEWSNIPWGDEFKQKTIAGVTADNGPDIVWVEDWANPTWINKKILVPISDYIDFKNPQFNNMSAKVKEFWTFDGKTYGYGAAKTNTNKLFYRTDMFKNNGLEDPYQLYLDGKWNWDKFFELGQELTQDTNGDGTVDQWGYDAWPIEQWFSTNGVKLVNMVDGKPQFGLNDPKAIESIQAIKDMDGKYKMKSPWDPNKDPQQKFIAGVTAMDYWGWWDHENFRNQLGDKLGFVSFPMGPSGTGKTADAITGALIAITSCTDDPEFIGKYIQYVWLPASKEEAAETEKTNKEKELFIFGNQEMIDYAVEMGLNSWQANYGGYGELSTILNKILWESPDMSPAQAIEAQKDAAQAAIDTVWNDR